LELLDTMRRSLLNPPPTDTGLGKGRLEDIGPLVLGQRLSARASQGAYTTLIYNKGALVLRMLHFLFTDPNTGNGQPFSDMMKDFVTRYAGRSAATNDFIAVVNERFPTTPIGRRLQTKDLDWFFRQWVYQTGLPSYALDYHIETQADGSFLLQGTLSQDDVPNDWFMPLPVRIETGKGRQALGVIYARGPQTPVRIRIGERPTKVELDPDRWILSAKTLTHRTK
jgi:aminopeptidase N